MRARPRTALAIAASLLIAGATTADETGSRRSWLGRVFDSSDSFSSPGVSLVVVADIPLPGPLPDGGARLVGERIEIPVAGGLALTGWTDGDEAEILTDAEAGGTIDEWSHDPRGRYRARVLASGKLLMQKKCKCKKGWRNKWRLGVPGDAIAPPLLTERRVYFGAKDNRVYGLQKRNGHRVWVTDIEHRISGAITLWSGELPAADDGDEPREFHALLVLPDVGSLIIGLDARNGQRVARLELPAEGGEFKGRPVITPDGKIAIAREKYQAADASLMVLALLEQPKSGPADTPEPTEEAEPPSGETTETSEKTAEIKSSGD